MRLFEKVIGVLIVSSIFVLTGCDDKGTTTVKEVTETTEDAVKSQTQESVKYASGEIDTHGTKDGKIENAIDPSIATAGAIHGATVLEVVKAPPYNYIKVDSNGKTFWAAVPEADVKVGETVAFTESMWMQNFTSKTLGRTFETLLFASNFEIITKAMQDKADIKVNTAIATPTVSAIVKEVVAPVVAATAVATVADSAKKEVVKEIVTPVVPAKTEVEKEIVTPVVPAKAEVEKEIVTPVVSAKAEVNCDCKKCKNECDCSKCDCNDKKEETVAKHDCGDKKDVKTEEVKEKTTAPVAAAAVAATAVATVADSAKKEIIEVEKKVTKTLTTDKKINTIEELYVQADDLNNTSVSVRGKVVKVSNGIMQRNWIHIQDGSGSKGDADIVFTSTTQSVEVGDEVTATGTLNTNVDFGYGYVYSVIVQESTFEK